MWKNNRGVALLITLSIITVLIAVGFELNRQVRDTVERTGVGRDQTTLQHLVLSGLGIAEAVLVQDKQNTEVDSVQEDWADPEMMGAYARQAGFDSETLSIVITDELARLQINALVLFPDGKDFNPVQHGLWMRFFDLLLARRQQSPAPVFSEPLEPAMIINPVKDWLDSGDNEAVTGLTGAESDYYRSLDPPYECRNGPFRHVAELLRVRNITPELFYRLEKDTGIRDYITVHGMTPAPGNRHDFTYPGKININTALLPVLAALLPPGHEFLAEQIAAYRQETAGGEYVHDLNSPTWYKEVAGMEDVSIDDSLITTRSDLFRIRCVARIHERSLAATVIVRREKDEKTGKWQCKVLNWQYE